jgi:hypothetical protein
VVSNTDAYALTEVFFPGYGWFGFDPIPGHELLPPSIKDSQTFSVLRQFWNWVAGWLPSPVTGWLTGVVTWLFTLFSRLVRFFSEGLVGFLAALLSAHGIFLPQLAAVEGVAKPAAAAPPPSAVARGAPLSANAGVAGSPKATPNAPLKRRWNMPRPQRKRPSSRRVSR